MKNQMEALKKECYESMIEVTFPEKLGLLEEFRSIKIFNKSFLKDVSVLFIQHHLLPFIGRLEIMKMDGMKPENTWFVDIPYSTNDDVLKKIRNEYTIHEYPEPLSDPLENYSTYQLGRVKTVIRNIIKSNLKKLLVIDDGAYFIRAVHELFLTEPGIADILYNKTYVVEQTTRGHRYLEYEKYNGIQEILNIPIVSIAKSKTKREIEAPFIGIGCRRSIEENDRILSLVNNYNKATNKQLKVAIIGYGSIGSAVFESIKKMLQPPYNIDVVEIDYKKWPEIKMQQGNPLSELSNGGYDMLFGCTGTASFSWNDRNKVNQNGLLISVSSASIEFSRANYIEFANLYPDDPITIEIVEPSKGIHSDLLFEDKNCRFYFINSGFPVNFTGKKESLPGKFIQPTHALMYAASYQVLDQPRKGLQALKEEYDNWIYYNAFNF
jgi:hypothetical protein